MSNKRDFTTTRSAGYQYVIQESVSPNESIAEYCDTTGHVGTISLSQNREELLTLQEELHKEYWNLIENGLTARQKKVLQLSAEGKTQTEIAKILNVNQSSITKSINGNVDYSAGKKIYGGAKKKCRKLADKNEKIQSLIQAINDLED
jgi:DNA-binding NarL/FixJ family response regulator